MSQFGENDLRFGSLSSSKLLPTGDADGSFRVIQYSSDEPSLSLLDGGLGPRGARRATGGAKGGQSSSLENTFRLFNLAINKNGQPQFNDPHESVPNVEGSDDAPDVVTKVELAAFHAGSLSDDFAEKAKATLRLDIGQDEMSQSPLRPLFWSVAAGLDLSNVRRGKDLPKRFRSDFGDAFTRRPIEIAGGLAEIRFEVFAHSEPKWWQKLFGALGNSSTKTLINALGFPGIVNEAVDVLNGAFESFGANAKPLFRSASMPFALSQRARDAYTMGMPGVCIGVLPRGFSLLVPHQYYEVIRETKPYFLGGYGRLVPGDISLDDFNSPDYQDQYEKIPYAVLKVDSKAASLQAF